jgi:Domain of unknown function (DUF3395)
MLEHVPPFWQGVLASLLATIVAGIAVQFSRIFSGRARLKAEQNREAIKKLRQRISSADSVLRVEGYFVALFRLLRYLLLGSLLWVVAWAITLFPFGFVFGVVVAFASLGAYYSGLRWLYYVTRPANPESKGPSGKLLILHTATYGAGSVLVDVKSALAERLTDGHLQVYAGNQLGGDPCPGKPKELLIDYSYDGIRHTRRLPEGEMLSLP